MTTTATTPTAALGTASWHFRRALSHLVAEAVAEHGLSSSELSVLSTVASVPGATNAEVARILDLTPQAVNQTVLRLTERGLLERDAHPTVARGLAARLSGTGEDLLARALRAAEAAYADLLSPLSPDEAAQLVSLLQRCGDAARTRPTETTGAP